VGGKGEGGGKGGEMTQTMYAHKNKKKKVGQFYNPHNAFNDKERQHN
jgi:hypothetical protein